MAPSSGLNGHCSNKCIHTNTQNKRDIDTETQRDRQRQKDRETHRDTERETHREKVKTVL